MLIEILPEGVTNHLPRSPPTTPTSPLSSTSPTFRHSQLRPISALDPIVTFTSCSAILAHSSFTVLYDGQAIYNEMADVNLLSTSAVAGATNTDRFFYYAAPLVPAYWSTICGDRGMFYSLYGISEFIRISLSRDAYSLCSPAIILQTPPIIQSSTTFTSTLDR